MTKKIWFIVGGVALGALLVWLAVRWLSSAVKVEAATAERGPIREFIDERAKTRLPETYLITMPYSARIQPIALMEGTPVRRGDAVAHVVSADLNLAVEQATAGWREAQAAIAQNADNSVEETASQQAWDFATSMKSATAAAEKQKQSAQAALEYAQRDLARIERLFRAGAETEDNLELARLRQVQRAVEYQQSTLTHRAMQSLQAATELLTELVGRYIARKRLEAAVLQQRQAQADARMKQALLDRQRGTMTSPVEGVVLQRAFSNEQFLPAGTTLLEIGRLEDLEVEADVLSQDVVRANPGDKVEIYGPAIGKAGPGGKNHVLGTLHQIYPAGFTKVSSLGVEEQRVKVVIRINDKDLQWLRRERNLGVGYRVRVRIYTAEKRDALVIPRSALLRGESGQWQAYAVRKGRARITDLKVGLINDQSAEITAGLSQGDEVVLAPGSDLEDGTRVTAKITQERAEEQND
jgi:HlyD family secretion protein